MRSSTARRLGIAAFLAAALIYQLFYRARSGGYANGYLGLTAGPFFAALSLVVVGAILLAASVELHFWGQWPRIDSAWQAAQALPEDKRASPKHARRLKLKKRFAELPNFGLVGAMIFAPFFFFFAALQHKPQLGLMVRVIKDPTVVNAIPGSEPPMVRIEPNGHFFVNGKQVPGANLQTALEEALRMYLSRGVLVDGDPETDYQSVVFAIASIQGVHGQGIIISGLRRSRRRDLRTLEERFAQAAATCVTLRVFPD